MRAEALKLANEIGVSGEHPDYPVIDWQVAVAHSETRERYWAMHYDNHMWLETQS